VAVGTDSQGEQGSEVDEAGGTGTVPSREVRVTGKRPPSGGRGKGARTRRGSRLLRFGVVVGETAGWAARGAFQARGWRTAGELVAPRGDHDPCEGNTLKEAPTGGSGTKQGRKTRLCQETAERLRKPESGTEVGLGRPASYGARTRDVVERLRKPQGSRVQPRGWRFRGGEELCRGARSKAE
jgi:hypothetical protein